MTVSLGRIPEKVLYTAACAEGFEEKLVTRKGKEIQCRRQVRVCLTSVLELGHLRLLKPARFLRAASALLDTQVN